MGADTAQEVNPHYLQHVIAAAESHEVEATEDVVAGNGIKLLAKGARIDARVRDRLLQHKLMRPLEECVNVVAGALPARLEPTASALLEQHPMLRALCAVDGAPPAPGSLAALALSVPVQSLLTVYSQCQAGRLEHAVGVAMLAQALARRLLPGALERHRSLVTAGLVHDVGELYIDPAYLRKDTRLDAAQWRHIVTHPLLAHRVLRDMPGAGPAVADAVLLHHERLDGFGYPRGISGDAFTMDGQIVAAAEWLMALAESGRSPLLRASLAPRLLPGEFCPALLQAVAAAGLAATLQRFRDARPWIDDCIAQARPELRRLLQSGVLRLTRIQIALSRSGLDARSPEQLLSDLAALHDPQLYSEVMTVIGEMEWRMRELEREQGLRAAMLPAAEQAVVNGLIERLKGVAAAPELARGADGAPPAAAPVRETATAPAPG